MAKAATITIRVPPVLRNDCGGASELTLSAMSVRGALEALQRSHPRLHGRICDETGSVRRHVNVFVNKEHMREQAGLDTVLAAGDVITVLPAVSGG